MRGRRFRAAGYAMRAHTGDVKPIRRNDGQQVGGDRGSPVRAGNGRQGPELETNCHRRAHRASREWRQGGGDPPRGEAPCAAPEVSGARTPWSGCPLWFLELAPPLVPHEFGRAVARPTTLRGRKASREDSRTRSWRATGRSTRCEQPRSRHLRRSCCLESRLPQVGTRSLGGPIPRRSSLHWLAPRALRGSKHARQTLEEGRESRRCRGRRLDTDAALGRGADLELRE